jgi:hypothetical protein
MLRILTGLIVGGVAGLMSTTVVAQQPSPTTPTNPPMQTTLPTTTPQPSTPGATPTTRRTPPATTTTPGMPEAPTHSTAPSSSSSTFTDAQLQNYAAARAALAPLHIQVTSSMSATDRSRVSTVLQQHHLTVSQYTAITERARSDSALNARLNGTTAPPMP